MAYITTEKVAQIRAKLKEEFPTKKGWKFSITKEHYSSLRVIILKSPFRFAPGDNAPLNHCYYEQYDNNDVLKRIIDVCNEGNHDNSDIMTDYFDVGWYFTVKQGDYDRPFECTTETPENAALIDSREPVELI